MITPPLEHPNSNQVLWDDPSIAERIRQGTETHRKGDAGIEVHGPGGQPLRDAEIVARQIDSEFRFGANIFKLGDWGSEEQNRGYEKRFLALFNGATVPFYWKDLEPAPGHLRFSAESERIARRPPPDVVVDFCQQHGLRMHGHTLVWNFLKWAVPLWLPEDPVEIERLIDKRIREIADRYGDVIPSWDVVNEAASDYPPELLHKFPGDYEQKAFASAARHFPKTTRLDINEITKYWYPHKRMFANLVRRLLDQGSALGGLGLQIHLFRDDDMLRFSEGELYPPADIFGTLDLYAEFALPIHISEITLTSPDNSERGLALQANAVEKLYRLWFSHPAVREISWWNVADGGAAPGEDTVNSGLLLADMSPKPACHVLQRLIHEEWRTTASGVTDADGRFSFRGFHGTYRIEINGQAVPENLHLTSRGCGQTTICM